MRKASTEMPKKAKIHGPPRAVETRTRMVAMAAMRAVVRRRTSLSPWVMPRNRGTAPRGLTITNSAMKSRAAVMRRSMAAIRWAARWLSMVEAPSRVARALSFEGQMPCHRAVVRTLQVDLHQIGLAGGGDDVGGVGV